LFVGYQTRIAAVVLAIFTFFATIFFHAYWAAPADQAFVAQLLFFKNVAVIGGLLVLAASGAGKFSIDGLKATQK
jgi:putative oxidoreductase